MFIEYSMDSESKFGTDFGFSFIKSNHVFDINILKTWFYTINSSS